MIIVTGTKRSGTSMWMQILRGAGFPVIGAAFPGKWGESIREANPAGFYESIFRQGIFFATNPDPRNGEFIFPKQVEEHAVKVFIPGLIRTDYAYVGHVLATMRSWREYAASLHRLYAMEDTWKAARLDDGGLGERDTESEHRVRTGRIPPALEWWFQNYDLIRDVATRRYAFHMLTYERLLEDPEREIRPVIDWLGRGDVDGAVAAVEPSLRTQRDPEVGDHGLDSEAITVFDELYDTVNQGRGLDPVFVERLNALHLVLAERWDEERKARMDKLSKGTDTQ